jgi:hypothetical protein
VPKAAAMERAYEASVSIRFVASADTQGAADEIAKSFAAQLAAWVDGSLGSPPFAPWVTAWLTDSPTGLEEDPSTWPLWRVTDDELSSGRPWDLNT